MKVKKIFQITLITILVIFAVDILLKILNSRLEHEKPNQPISGRVISDSKENRPIADFAKISLRNLFQSSKSTEPEEPSDDNQEDHPLTELKLILKGTVVGSKERSFAIIEDAKMRTQNLYHLDDSITSGVTLSAIQNDRVVINRSGRKELLLMFQEDTKGSKKNSTPVSSVRTEPTRTVERQEIQEAAGDLKTLMRDVRIIPHFTSGKRDGFTVTYVRQGSRLEELGMQKNDIVKEINGTPAEEFRNIFEIFNKYSGDDTLDLGIERDNQLINITYSIE